MSDLSFYRGKTVVVTGHTGFKGSWMCMLLALKEAKVIGYALVPNTSPTLFEEAGIEKNMISVIGDVRDRNKLCEVFWKYKPDIAFHMAAQPIVRTSYEDPTYTYDVNVMGTVNFCEAVRLTDSVKSAVIITTDKVYRNNEWEWGYREIDALDGHDPYSNSKACSELVTGSYKKSFFAAKDIALSTCRAGNVIGGGDFARDRIIPDCVRATIKKDEILVRNPYSTRPYQHVLEPIYAYLLLAEAQYKNKELQGSYNIGPDDADCVSTETLVNLFCQLWGKEASWKAVPVPGASHEANFLKLDCSKAKQVLSWKPRWDIRTAIEKTIDWSRAWASGQDVSKVMETQIDSFLYK